MVGAENYGFPGTKQHVLTINDTHTHPLIIAYASLKHNLYLMAKTKVFPFPQNFYYHSLCHPKIAL